MREVPKSAPAAWLPLVCVSHVRLPQAAKVTTHAQDLLLPHSETAGIFEMEGNPGCGRDEWCRLLGRLGRLEQLQEHGPLQNLPFSQSRGGASS